MLQQGYCYLRLFAFKYHQRITAMLGQNPTFSRVEQQRGISPHFHKSDSFVTAYISGPFQSHITKSRKENPFHLGTLRRLNSGMPIRVSASQPLILPAPPRSMEVVLIDVPMLPATDNHVQAVVTTAVQANQMTIAQQRMVQAA